VRTSNNNITLVYSGTFILQTIKNKPNTKIKENAELRVPDKISSTKPTIKAKEKAKLINIFLLVNLNQSIDIKSKRYELAKLVGNGKKDLNRPRRKTSGVIKIVEAWTIVKNNPIHANIVQNLAISDIELL
jgi:hypothetical protein